jgi:hypothetical protein
LGIDCITGVIHPHNSGTDYPFLESELAPEGYSSKFSLAIVKVGRKVASLFSIGLREETQVDGVETNLAVKRSGRRTRRADGSFGLGRGRRWFKVSSSTRVGTEHSLDPSQMQKEMGLLIVGDVTQT